MSDSQPTRRGRPSTFDLADLIAVAIELGPDKVTLNKVASALAVPRTTVYNRVRSPTELGQLVLSSLIGAVPPGGGEPAGNAPWQAHLEAFARAQRVALLAAGPWLRFYDPEIHVPRETLQSADCLLEVLAAAGFSAEMAGHALALVTVVVQHSVRLHLGDDNPSYLSRLSAEEFPWITAAGVIRNPDWDEQQFSYNLQCAVAGISEVLRRASNVERHPQHRSDSGVRCDQQQQPGA